MSKPEPFDINAFNERDMFFDIENLPDKTICCISLVDSDNEDTYFFSIFDVDQFKVETQLKDKQWLAKMSDAQKGTEVAPLTGRVTVISCRSEHELLEKFFSKIESLGVHCLVAWNAEFDKEELEERSKLNHMYSVFEKVVVFDLMQSFATLNKNDSFRGRAALKFSCIDKLGYGKLEDNGKKIASEMQLYMDEQPDLLACYNIWDSVIARRLNVNMGNIIKFYRTYTDYATCTLEDFYDNIKMVEMLLMHRNFPLKRVLPSKFWINYKGRIEGALVMNPRIGLFMKSFELDLTKAYPTTIISGNYSTETYIERPWEVCRHGDRCKLCIENLVNEQCWKCKKFVAKDGIKLTRVPSGRLYRQDIEGSFPNLLKHLKNMREKYQKEYKKVCKAIDDLESKGKHAEADLLKPIKEHLFAQQFTMKSISNAFYGVLASPKFRLSNSDIAADVTWVVRDLIKWNIDHISKIKLEYCGIKVSAQPVYSDTDGVKCSISNVSEIEAHLGREMSEADVDAIATLYEKMLNDSYPDFSETVFGHRTAEFEVKKETIYKSLYIWGMKKQYIYSKFPKGDRKAEVVKVGIKRSDRNKVFKDFTDKVGALILEGKFSEIGDVVREFDTGILTGEKDNDLGTPKGIQKEEHSDGSISSFWESMQFSNREFGKNFVIKDKPVFWKVKFIKGRGMPKNKIVALEWGEKPQKFDLVLDRELYLEDLKRSVESFLAPLGRWDDYRNMIKRKTVKSMWG